jgi:hypothetical protein
MGGSVLPSLIVMAFEGEGVTVRNASTEQAARWFIGHEGAHFWLGETIRHAFARDAWITEGGADLLAMRALSLLDPAYSAGGRLNSAFDDCARLAVGKPLERAAEESQNRAYYACGSLFGLVAEAFAKRTGGDFFTFWRGVIDANRADGVVTTAEWLAELKRLSHDPKVARDIQAMVETGVPDPSSTLLALFDRAGISYTRSPDGKVRLS